MIGRHRPRAFTQHGLQFFPGKNSGRAGHAAHLVSSEKKAIAAGITQHPEEGDIRKVDTEGMRAADGVDRGTARSGDSEGGCDGHPDGTERTGADTDEDIPTYRPVKICRSEGGDEPLGDFHLSRDLFPGDLEFPVAPRPP